MSVIPKRAIRLLHSSDLHLTAERGPVDRLLYLRWVLDAAEREAADVVLLAGDVFDHIRQPIAFIEDVAALLSAKQQQVVILPGNHDPLTPDSVYFRGGLMELPGVQVIGRTTDDPVSFPEWDLSIWGRAHRDYADMSPLRHPPARAAAWHVVMAHGHFQQTRPSIEDRFLPSWIFDEEDLAQTAADYVALGHWNHPVRAGRGPVPAYYSGSPDLAGTANLVLLSPGEEIQVRQVPLDGSS